MIVACTLSVRSHLSVNRTVSPAASNYRYIQIRAVKATKEYTTNLDLILVTIYHNNHTKGQDGQISMSGKRNNSRVRKIVYSKLQYELRRNKRIEHLLQLHVRCGCTFCCSRCGCHQPIISMQPSQSHSLQICITLAS